jgi:Family of unknown function (DUF6493)
VSRDRVLALVKAGDTEGSVALLEDETPEARLALHDAARKIHDWMHEGDRSSGEWVPNGTDEQRQAAGIAVAGTSSLRQFKKGDFMLPTDNQDAFVDAMRRLRPPWLAKAAGLLLDRTPHLWWLAHLLVNAGLSDKPEGEVYILGMMGDGIYGWGRYPELRTLLVEHDPSLLQDEVWRLFEVEGSGEYSLAAYDKYRGEWGPTLVQLSEEGHLSRDRLLDASLEALERDFAQFRAGWHSRFHELLAPTIDERAVRQERYRRLLGSAVPPTVTFALKALTVLAKQERLETDELLDALEPALLARAKSSVKMATKLAMAVAQDKPASRTAVAVVLASALAHEATDLQKMVFGRLEALAEPGTPQVADAIAPYASGVQPSLRDRLRAWLGAEAEPTDDEHTAASLVSVPDRLDPARRLAPIADVEELVNRLSYVLENAEDVMQVERVLDGVSRFAASAKLTGPLAKRAAKIREDQMGEFGRLELARLASSWCTRKPLKAKRWGRENPLRIALQDRFDAIIARIRQREHRPLLSLPTHQGGWIEPSVLVERVASIPSADIHDQVIALLRLAPDGREHALAAAKGLDGEMGQALRHALGAKRVRVGKTAALWIAAARARAPVADDPAVAKQHAGHGPGAAEAARHRWRVLPPAEREIQLPTLDIGVTPEPPASIPSSHLAVHLCNPTAWFLDHGTDVVGYDASLWPAQRDGFFANGAIILFGNIDWFSAHWHNRKYLEPLCDPHAAMTQMALLVLAIGLAAKEPGEKGLAVDAFIAAWSEGRLDPGALGGVMAVLLHSGDIKAARWAATLGEVASVSTGHAGAVTTALLTSLSGDPANLPRDVGKLLGLLHELLIARGEARTHGDARAYLSTVKRGGKAGKLAKQIVALLADRGAAG